MKNSRCLLYWFLDAQPTPSEEQTYREVEAVLKCAQAVLEALLEYKGAGKEIREAIASSGCEEAQQKAAITVLPLVAKLREFYQFSGLLGT